MSEATIITPEEFAHHKAVREGKVTELHPRKSIFDTFKSAFGSEEKAKEALMTKHRAILANVRRNASEELGHGPTEQLFREEHERTLIAKEYIDE